MKVLFLTNIPSPYRVDFFNELGKSCQLRVLFERGQSDERDESWTDYQFRNFEGIVLNGRKTAVDGAFSMKVISYLKEQYDWIVVCNAMSPTGLLATLYMRMRRKRYWIEGDGAFCPASESKWKFWLKKLALSGAAGYLSTCKNHDRYYLHYGAETAQIHHYPFSSVKECDIVSKPLSQENKNALRKKLGMTEKYVVITVGQFINRKGFDVLLEASKLLNTDIGFYFIGGTELELDGKAQNVHTVPFQNKESLNMYYDAADLFVCPTREDIWGLVVNEAMSRGLPVVVTDCCNAGLELVNGENGYIVPVEDTHTLANRISQMLFCDDREKMGKESLKAIHRYTIEEMAYKHIKIYEENNK